LTGDVIRRVPIDQHDVRLIGLSRLSSRPVIRLQFRIGAESGTIVADICGAGTPHPEINK